MKTFIPLIFACIAIFFNTEQVNAQGSFNLCCETSVNIDSDGSVTAFIGNDVTIFKVWNGGWLLAELNEFNGDVIPSVINSIDQDSSSIDLPCQGGNFWISIECDTNNDNYNDEQCFFNASQNFACKTSRTTLDTESVDIYPNPVVDFININLPFVEEVYTINVLDLSGKIVETTYSNGGEVMLSTENLNAGLCIVNVKSETKNYTQKLQIVK